MRWMLVFIVGLIAHMAVAEDYADLREPKNAAETHLSRQEAAAQTDWAAAKQLAALYYQYGRFQQGLEYVTALLAKTPADQDLQALRTQLYLARIGQKGLFGKIRLAGRMTEACEADLARDPNNAAALQCLGQYYLRAPGIAGGDRDKGLVYAQQLEPIDKARYYFLRYVDQEKRDRAEAARFIALAVEANPTLEVLGIAVRYHLAAGEWEQARPYLQQWQSLWPDDPERTLQAARAAVLAEQPSEQAVAELLAFLRGPTLIRGRDQRGYAHYLLGRLYELTGDILTARKAYQRAVGLDREIDGLQAALDRLG